MSSPPAVRAATLWTDSFDKDEMYRSQVSLWHHVDVGCSLDFHSFKPQLLKRKWSEDMTQNVRRSGENFGLRRVRVANLLMIRLKLKVAKWLMGNLL